MTQQKKYLLATAPVSGELVEEAAGHDVALDVIPFIGIEYMDCPDMEKLLTQPLTVVFTSVNAVNAIGRQLNQKPEWRIYCLTGPTCATVTELFSQQAVAGTATSAKELAALIHENEPGPTSELIFFCGDHRREELPSLGVTEKIVYRTTITPQKLERNYDGIAFFSPSAVDSLIGSNKIPSGTPLFAIGPTTAAAISAACPKNPVFTVQQPDKATVIREMIDYILFNP